MPLPIKSPVWPASARSIASRAARADPRDALAEKQARAFPAFSDAPFSDAVLKPGDALYVPPGWFHYVQSVTSSFSVSFWWK